MWRWFAAAAALLGAILLNTFYVDYKVNAKNYLVSWSATPSQRSAEIDKRAAYGVRSRQAKNDYGVLSLWYASRDDHLQRYCEGTTRYFRISKWDRPFHPDPNDKVYFRCSKKFTTPMPQPRRIVTPGVDFATARASVVKEYASKEILYGMVPSLVVAGEEPSREAFVKSYWLGVIVPAALSLFGLFLLITIVRGRKKGVSNIPVGSLEHVAIHGDAPRRILDAKDILGAADAKSVEPVEQVSLADLLRSDLGQHFPVSGGNGKEDSPLVITAETDYVSVEYAVVRHVLSAVGEAYQLNNQALLNRDGRHIDMLVFDVKDAGSADWQGLRRFYFDITAGFGALR